MYPQNMNQPPSNIGSFQAFNFPTRLFISNMDKIKGFRIDFSFSLNPFFNITNSFNFPTIGPKKNFGMGMQMGSNSPSYSIASQYVGDVRNMVDPWLIMAVKSQTLGKLEGSVQKKLSKNVMYKFAFSYPSKQMMQWGQFQHEFSYQKKNSNMSIRYGFGMLTFNMLQRIGKSGLTLGFDYSSIIHKNSDHISLTAQYINSKKHELSFHYVAMMKLWQIIYLIPLRKNSFMLSAFEVNQMKQVDNMIKSIVVIVNKQGLKQRFTSSEVNVVLSSKAKIHSSFTYFGTMFSMKLYGSADLRKQKYKFGYGLILGNAQF